MVKSSTAATVSTVKAKVQVGMNLIVVGSKPEAKAKGGKGKAKADDNGHKKTECPVTEEQFIELAKYVSVTVNGQPLEADPKMFSTGSFGWYVNGKVNVEVRGTEIIKPKSKSEPGAKDPAYVCPVTADDFIEYPCQVVVVIGSDVIEGTLKIFSTGSFGWNVNGKAKVKVGEHTVKVQVGGNLIMVGSKPVDE